MQKSVLLWFSGRSRYIFMYFLYRKNCFWVKRAEKNYKFKSQNLPFRPMWVKFCIHWSFDWSHRCKCLYISKKRSSWKRWDHELFWLTGKLVSNFSFGAIQMNQISCKPTVRLCYASCKDSMFVLAVDQEKMWSN